MKRVLAAAILALAAAAPGSALAWWNGDWAYRQPINLDATQRGVSEKVERAPMLVRLHSGIVDFADLKDDGSDLRFIAGDDRTALNFHIEKFDRTAGMALIWVDVPDLAPGQTKQIWMYYGNQAAALAANPAQTYDGPQSLVFHFGEGAGAPVDATANGNRASAATARPAADGLIAGALSFAPQAQVRVAASQSLAPADGALTWSGWVRPAAGGAAVDGLIASKFGPGGEGAGERLSISLRNGAPVVELISAAGRSEITSPTALVPGAWTHVAVTVAKDGTRLYVNGGEAAKGEARPLDLSGEMVLGAAAGAPGFTGDLDEVGFANVARPASYIALTAAGQGRSSTVASVAEAEQKGSGEHNYFGVLFKALTPDAWVVIAILAVMGAISWWVMYSRNAYLSRASRANRAFRVDFDQAMQNAPGARQLPRLDPALHADAPLYRMYAAGAEQTRQELNDAGAAELNDKSVDVIRSALNAQFTRELSQLNKAMVMLTIAISGGPFLGLLGTVIGVMITFAAIAAAGDVNINAIAPGVAAALLATVAGLGVAIPALFGYNYLTTKIQDVGGELEVFVDEFATRIAKTFG